MVKQGIGIRPQVPVKCQYQMSILFLPFFKKSHNPHLLLSNIDHFSHVSLPAQHLKSLRLPLALLPCWGRASRPGSPGAGTAACSASDKKGIWGRKHQKEIKRKCKGSLCLCVCMGFFSRTSEINSSQGELCVVSPAIQVKLQLTPAAKQSCGGEKGSRQRGKGTKKPKRVSWWYFFLQVFPFFYFPLFFFFF